MKSKFNRKCLIAGNWKMNKTIHEARELAQEIVDNLGRQTEVGVLLCPSFTSLESVAKIVEGSTVSLGAQNLYPEACGAFTGEVSPDMLRTLFVTYVILGHSERRAYFGESNEFINKKVHAALENNLKPILCVGESLLQRESNQAVEVVKMQLVEGLKGVEKVENVVIAYEPVWAIGTGKTATPDMVQEMHGMIRGVLSEIFNEEKSEKVRILYGGSMNKTNAAGLLELPDVDGGLIGGAALDAKGFLKIIEDALALV